MRDSLNGFKHNSLLNTGFEKSVDNLSYGAIRDSLIIYRLSNVLKTNDQVHCGLHNWSTFWGYFKLNL